MGQVIREGKEGKGSIIQGGTSRCFTRSRSVGDCQSIGGETALPFPVNRIVETRQLFRIFLRKDHEIRRIIVMSFIIG